MTLARAGDSGNPTAVSRRVLLWSTSFLAGGAVMVVELTGARILAPTFGASLVPWTAVIAAVLLGVAVGNAWGGRRSRVDPIGSLVVLLVLSAVAVLLPLARFEMPGLLARTLGPVAGAIAIALILFLVPSIVLGALGPLVVAAATEEISVVGRRSGGLNGAHHVGAIAGTVITGFVLIPLLPLSRILMLTAVALAAAGLLFTRLRRAGP